MNFKITLLPGDGIGPEVVGEAVRVLDFIAGKHHHTFNFTERLMGGCSIDEYGPFAVKMRGGMRLVGPGEHPHVPQCSRVLRVRGNRQCYLAEARRYS